MNYRYLAGALALSAAIATAACGDDPPPTQPTPAPAPPPPPANPVLTAPTVDSPAEDAQLSTLRPTLRRPQGDVRSGRTRSATSSRSRTTPTSSRPVRRTWRATTGSWPPRRASPKVRTTTTFTVAADLQPATRFYWRARARQGTVDGPWSARSTFRTRVAGYNVPGELYDPLTTGTTVGQVVGSVTLTPGRGATINSNESHIRYQLPQTVIAGEFSMEVDGIQNNSPGDKAKIMSMYDGNGDITTSDYRMTVEKRDSRHHRLALHRRRDRQPRNPDRDDRRRARRRSTSTRRRPTCGVRAGATASSASRSSTAARPPTGSTSSARATTAPTIRRRTWPSSARRSGAAVRTTRRSSARPGATSTWARPPGRVRPRWARRSSRIRTRIRASRTAASAPPTSRAPRHELEAPAPSRGPALFSSREPAAGAQRSGSRAAG